MRTSNVQHPTLNVQSRSGARTAAGFIGRWALCCALAAAAHADPRTSANYTITADTVDSGGRRTTSASYRNDGSLGGITGISTVAAPVETVKHGYVAQLYDVIGLTLTAAFPTVPEGGTDQFAASQLLDDGTLLFVRANNVAWGIAGGPLTGIDFRGLATAGLVYQNTLATVQGTFLGQTGTLGITVQNVNIDDFGSYAADGIDDAWQVQYFGLPPNANAGPLLDPDHDGQNNLFEYVAGLTPTDPTSVFTLTIVPVPGQNTRKNLIFSPLVAGRTYAVKLRLDLATGSWQTLTGTTQADSGTERTVTDLNATEPTKFYRVEITKP